jgi:hypothetical protein
MPLLECLQSHVTVNPQGHTLPGCGATRFRWTTHVALPFTLPSRACIHKNPVIGGREFEYSIHNYFDRLTVFPASQTTWPSVYLIPRSYPTPPAPPGWKHSRETIQSVAHFVETEEHGNPDAAFLGATEKIKACFGYLSDHLAALQSAMPYLTAWQIYPISQYDVGLVYHQVEHFCLTKSRWDHSSTGVSINLAHLLHHPSSLISFPQDSVAGNPADLSNELLAEAQVSQFRGLCRSAVLNSYQAVEALANVVFKTKQTAKLTAEGSVTEEAEVRAEQIRKKNRTEIKFLVHVGLLEACGRSLCQEDKARYDALCILKKMRNEIAHVGKKVSSSEAKEAHQLCCEVVRWLCGVGGFRFAQCGRIRWIGHLKSFLCLPISMQSLERPRLCFCGLWEFRRIKICLRALVSSASE